MNEGANVIHEHSNSNLSLLQVPLTSNLQNNNHTNGNASVGVPVIESVPTMDTNQNQLMYMQSSPHHQQQSQRQDSFMLAQLVPQPPPPPPPQRQISVDMSADAEYRTNIDTLATVAAAQSPNNLVVQHRQSQHTSLVPFQTPQSAPSNSGTATIRNLLAQQPASFTLATPNRNEHFVTRHNNAPLGPSKSSPVPKPTNQWKNSTYPDSGNFS